MSASTSSADTVRALMADAFDCVARECPDAHRALQAALGTRCVALSIDGERFDLDAARHEGGWVTDARPRAGVTRVETTARSVRDVLTGARDPIDAILADEIVLHGSAGDFVVLGEAGLLFVKGAVRCTSIEPLLARLSALADREPERTKTYDRIESPEQREGGGR